MSREFVEPVAVAVAARRDVQALDRRCRGSMPSRSRSRRCGASVTSMMNSSKSLDDRDRIGDRLRAEIGEVIERRA